MQDCNCARFYWTLNFSHKNHRYNYNFVFLSPNYDTKISIAYHNEQTKPIKNTHKTPFFIRLSIRCL